MTKMNVMPVEILGETDPYHSKIIVAAFPGFSKINRIILVRNV